MEKINVFGKEIRKGYCSCLPVRVRVKRFDNQMLVEVGDFFNTELVKSADGQGKTKNSAISMTEDKILEFYNEASSVEIKEELNEKLLIIDTTEFKLFVVIETKKKGVAQ